MIESQHLPKKLTIYEIAKLSGVSVSTVSRVLNNSPYVSSKTKEHVTDIINQYHFSPSTVARAMISNQTQTLGVIISDITNPYFSELYLEIQRYAVDFGYSLILCNTFYGGSSHGVSDAIPENSYFQTMLDKKVDGVLILGGEIDRDQISDSYKEALNRLGSQVPVVILGQTIPDCCCTFINRNFSGGVSALIHHLLAAALRGAARGNVEGEHPQVLGAQLPAHIEGVAELVQVRGEVVLFQVNLANGRAHGPYRQPGVLGHNRYGDQ